MAGFLCAAIACVLGMGIPALGLVSPVNPEALAEVSGRTLTFRQRIAYQRAIEEVYWRHRIWPKENGHPKPPLDAVISQAQIERKVEVYLRKSQVVTDQRGWPISASELQAEMDRMASHTKQPAVLHELFEALGNDAFVIAECLARPIVAERLLGQCEGGWTAPRTMTAKTEGQEFLIASRLDLPSCKGLPDPPSISTEGQGDNAAYKLPEIPIAAECTDNTWTATSTVSPPDARVNQTAVWTGSELIVWGGFNSSPPYRLNTGGRYNPSTDSWVSTSLVNAPSPRDYHSGVWTGNEMIVWGGEPILNDGGRYNPTTDSWTPTSTINAPDARESHSAVWAGSEMVVWGGRNCCTWFNTGGRYNPSTDSWTATSTINAPDARWGHTAVWTGSEMIVWGGTNQTIYLNTGGRYNPSDNSWAPTTTASAPLGRVAHTSIWTGSEMTVWGGVDSTFNDTNTGSRYNPTGDSWTSTSTINAPSARDFHSAVWTGTEMIVWGGEFGNPAVSLDTGGRYSAGTDSWTATSTANVPHARDSHTAVWTGSEMIIWGGGYWVGGNYILLNTGGRYCAQTGSPTPTPTPGPITLSAAGRKVGGINTVRLTWSGATSINIDVYRDRALIVTTANDGTYTDSTGDTGRARYTYRVCEAGTQTCSNNARVTFRQ